MDDCPKENCAGTKESLVSFWALAATARVRRLEFKYMLSQLR